MLTEENIQNRKKGIGASEVAAVLGICPFYTPYELWCVKTGRMQKKDILNESQSRIRHFHEETIAKEYEARNNCKVYPVPETLYHKDYPFVLCHLDRKIEGEDKLLECKSAFSFIGYMWGVDGSDEVPLNYIVQVQYQLAITGYQEADLAVLIGTDDFRTYHFKRDEVLISKILDEVKKFWQCVETDTQPELINRNDAMLAYPKSNGDLKEAEPEVLKIVEDFRDVRAKAKELDEEREKLTNALTLFIKEADGIKIGQEILATWKPTIKGNRVLKVMELR